MDLTVADFLEHFNGQDGVDVVACYVEGFRPGDGARFLAAIGEARRRGKRVVVFKAGKTALGAQAAASHTASLAGDYAVAKACLESAGATVAESLDEFEDLLKTFTLLAGRPARPAAGGHHQQRRLRVLDGDGSRSRIWSWRSSIAATQAVLDAGAAGVRPPHQPHRLHAHDRDRGLHRQLPGHAGLAGGGCGHPRAVPVTPALDNLPADPAGSHRRGPGRPGLPGLAADPDPGGQR